MQRIVPQHRFRSFEFESGLLLRVRLFLLLFGSESSLSFHMGIRQTC
jgi:hypothetical protein